MLDDILLEVECPQCDGTGGRHYVGDEARRCATCRGSGHLVTKAGAKILALIRHNFRSMTEDLAGEPDPFVAESRSQFHVVGNQR